ncbi:2-C-methyl-D-erythritol 4-phosphate cytidylyltransferase [Candidatus Latescibacterota bacterium]
MKAGAILVAGGTGTRMGTTMPKQLLKLDGVTILERTLASFTGCPDIVQVVIVAAESIIGDIESITNNLGDSGTIIKVTHGGKERQDSVFNGINALDDTIDTIAIHDAVRPFITPHLVSECLRVADHYGAVSVMRPVKETIKVVRNGLVEKTPDRSTLWITQTPQAFSREVIIEAHRNAIDTRFTGTDDCMLVERIGHPVHVIEGSDMNIKITTQADLVAAEALLKRFPEQE